MNNYNDKDENVTTGEIMGFLKENMVMKSDFDDLAKKVDGLAVRVDGLDNKVGGLVGRFDKLEKKVDQLPTKDYLEDRLLDLKTELKSEIRAEASRREEPGHHRIDTLVGILHKKDILEDHEVKRIQVNMPLPASNLK